MRGTVFRCPKLCECFALFVQALFHVAVLYQRTRLVMMLQSRLARIKYRKLVNGDILQEQFYTVAPIRVFGSHVLRCILRCLGRSSNGIVPRSTRAKVRPLVIYLRVGLPHAYSGISLFAFCINLFQHPFLPQFPYSETHFLS